MQLSASREREVFRPVVLSITIESKKELDLLFHAFNHNRTIATKLAQISDLSTVDVETLGTLLGKIGIKLGEVR